MQFRLSKTASGGTLEVRFTRLAKYKHRFTPPEIIGLLNEGGANGEFDSVKYEEQLQRVKGWELLSGSYVAKFICLGLSSRFFCALNLEPFSISVLITLTKVALISIPTVTLRSRLS